MTLPLSPAEKRREINRRAVRKYKARNWDRIKDKEKERQRRWREKNRNHLIEKRKKDYWADPEQHRKRSREYYENTKHLDSVIKKRREYSRKYREENRELLRERYRQYQAENPDRARQYYEANRERYRKTLRKNALRRKYGLTVEEYDAIFAAQNSCCAICKTSEPKTKNKWHVDHDHATGLVRGILCNPCNLALGYLRDCEVILREAAAYVEHHKARAQL